MIKKLCIILCVILLVVPFYGCQRETGSGKTVRYDIPYGITNLDPQFVTDVHSRMIIANIGEGLLTRDENGNLTNGVAESYTVSQDGKTLTFKLREDACWSDGKPVTADDFVFAFKRLFSASLPSPHAKDYSAIEMAAEILSGDAEPDMLGVSAPNEKILEIRLSHPSPYFPAVLSETPSFPCNKEFFTEARGRYGLGIKFIYSNGPFRLEKWDNESVIQLRPSSKYTLSPVTLSGVNLYPAAEDPAARFNNGSTDLSGVAFEDAEKLIAQNYSVTGFESIVWCIVFNQNSKRWGNPLLRQGLASTIEQELLMERLPEKLTPTGFFLPASVTLADKPYRKNVSVIPVGFDPETGRRLFDTGLSALSLTDLPEATFYVPNSPEHFLAMGMVQQSWQKHLDAYINVVSEPLDTLRSRLASGDFEMMLLPFSPASPDAGTWLGMFKSNSPENNFDYNNALYDSSIESAYNAESFEEASDSYAHAESLLLHDALIIPVYTETTGFATTPNVRGIPPTPYPAGIRFKYVEK